MDGLVRASLVAAAIACTSWGALAASDEFVYDIRDNVPPAQVTLIKSALALAQDYLDQFYGGAIDPERQAKIVVKIEATGIGNQDAGSNGGNATGLDASGPRPYFDVAHKDWAQNTDGRGWTMRADQTKTVIHEYVHGWQSWLGALTIYQQPLGDWVNEGLAEYIAYNAVISTGKMSKRNVDRFMIGGAAVEDEFSRPLHAYGTSSSAAWAGHIGYLAIDWLVAESPNGPMSLRIIATEIARGKGQLSAFRTAFNIELKDFYVQFEPWRQQMRKNPFRALSNRPPLINIGD